MTADFCRHGRDDGKHDIGAVEYDGDGPCDTRKPYLGPAHGGKSADGGTADAARGDGGRGDGRVGPKDSGGAASDRGIAGGDGGHQGTDFTPLELTIEEKKKVALCSCKHTGNAPFCDGAHEKL